MADQDEAKTKWIGYLPIEKVQTLKGWDEYLDKSSKLSIPKNRNSKSQKLCKRRFKRTA